MAIVKKKSLYIYSSTDQFRTTMFLDKLQTIIQEDQKLRAKVYRKSTLDLVKTFVQQMDCHSRHHSEPRAKTLIDTVANAWYEYNKGPILEFKFWYEMHMPLTYKANQQTIVFLNEQNIERALEAKKLFNGGQNVTTILFDKMEDPYGPVVKATEKFDKIVYLPDETEALLDSALYFYITTDFSTNA